MKTLEDKIKEFIKWCQDEIDAYKLHLNDSRAYYEKYIARDGIPYDEWFEQEEENGSYDWMLGRQATFMEVVGSLSLLLGKYQRA